MKVEIDATRCQGHGRCYAVAPDLFEPDEVGNGVVIGSGVVSSAGLAKAARLAAANCPEGAVITKETERVDHE